MRAPFVAVVSRVICGAVFAAVIPFTHATIFTDRTAFVSAVTTLGLSTATDGYERYALGNLTIGQTLGAFVYTFDPTIAQPGVASDGAGGQALGDTSLGTDPTVGTGVFVGGEAVTLTFGGSSPLRAFGVDFFYAPAFEDLPADIYQMEILDGNAAGTTLGNPAGLTGAGGSFFLGFIEDPSSSFRQISLQSVASATDPSGNPFLVPAYQIDNLIFGPSSMGVPEPGALELLLLSILTMLLMDARRRRRSA